MKCMLIIGVSGGRQANQDITYGKFFVESAGSADSDDVFYIILGEKFPGINAHGRHAHAASLYGNWNALVGSGVTVHIADF